MDGGFRRLKMDIPKEKLGLMGISIKANRKALLKETKAAKWTQLHFASDICSPNTLMNIERGKASRFPELYGQLASKFDMKVCYNQDLDEMLDKLTQKLYTAVEYHDIEKIRYHCNRALDALKNYSDALWYCDLYKVIKLIKDYHIKGTLLSENLYDFYIEILEEFPYHICEIIKSITISSVFEDTSPQSHHYFYNILEIGKSNSTFNEVNKLVYYFSLNKTSKFQELAKYLEEKCIADKNYLRLTDTYNLSITYFSYFDQDLVDVYAGKIDSLIKEKKESISSKLYDIYFCLGIAYHEICRYKDAIDFLWKSYELDVNKIKRTFLFLANAQRKLDLDIEIPRYSDDDLKKFPIDDKMMYKYYCMEEENIPIMFRQKFIMEKVLPNLHGSDDFSIGIMKQELAELVQLTNQYKDLLVFEIKIRELKGNQI